MKSVPSQERIVFFLFQPIRRARAFLIARGHVARRRFAQRFGFGAFQRDDFLSHGKCRQFTRETLRSYSLVFSTGAGSSSPSVSPPSSSVKPKSDVTDWRTREALFCFSSCD